ncbi:MAG: NAD(P)-dependent oxidoreductase, partial [Pseudomonadota bacterium]
MPKLFPAFHKHNDRPIIIVGGGELATRKARLAYDASTENPEVSQNVSPLFLDGALEEEVVAPTPGLNFIWPSFEADVAREWQGKAAFHHREPVEADFRGAGLVFIAIEDEA